ncbi:MULTISPECIES: glycosyltransferase [unclassified Micromonospora]|uniref:glycosyltransferase family 4 protein n=1 Tax=unclassified Micromonospora TaxID=2617518 RepID=UPI0022B7507D|nr:MULTISPECIES: glycosyltransferase [unclassified Micromonospora]MCZ7418624.1 glycosyltransferase [Verrucosispora sp. WMMA2121]WBB92330.1 glycosyltransferase [Verrucosispora sp. WMMC514]
MHVLITVVGARTEHWTDLFSSLCERPDLRLTVLAAEVSPATRREFDRLGQRYPSFHSQVLPHRLGEARTGHMASVVVQFGGRGGPPVSQPPDVVHIIGEAAYLSTWQVLRMRRRHWPAVPTTLYAAQNVVTRFPMPFPLVERYAYREVDMILPITPAARQVLRVKGYRGAATNVPLGVDTTIFRPRAEAAAVRPFTVGFVGRFEPHKGVLDLLRAADLADCDVLLVGDGSLTADIDRAAWRRPGRIRRHRWTGHAQLPDLLAQMSVLALPAREIVQRNVLPWVGIPLREQFGRVLVEAMACGVPVIGSDVGEIPYVIGNAGLVFPAGDPAALAERLVELRACPATARGLSATGVHRATNEFAWDRIADRLAQIWQQLHETSMSVPIPARAGQKVRDNADRKVIA